MFAKYQCKGGSKISEVHADIVAILTGTTDKATLSNSCDQPTTSITSTVASGWTTTTGSQYGLDYRDMPATGMWHAKPVNNGTVTLWPCMGTNKICRSTNNGATWTAITLPQVLGSTVFSNGAIENLAYSGTHWVLTDPTASLAYIFTSNDDGLTWSQVSTTTAQQWHTPVWNGTIWVITALLSTQAIVTSTDAVTWTYAATALPSAAVWGTPVWNGTIWVVTLGNINSIPAAGVFCATSANGTTWTSRTIPSYQTWKPQYAGGIWIIASLASSTTTVLSSIDGITWTSRTGLTSGTYKPPQWNGSMWVMTGYSTNTLYVASSPDGITWTTRLSVGTSATALACCVWVPWLSLWVVVASGSPSAIYTSADAVTWTLRTHPSISSTIITLCFSGNLIFAFSSNLTFAVSRDGITWSRGLTSVFGNNLTSNISVPAVLAQYANEIYLYSTTTASSKAPMLRLAVNNANIRALNADGTTYKEVIVDSSCGQVRLCSAEDFGVETAAYPIYNSDSGEYGQQIDLVNGSTLYICATARYIVILSYLPTGTIYGSPTGNGFTGIFEYSRDDGWNVSADYPTHCWLNSSLSATNWYVPRVKSQASNDVYGANAYLLPFIVAPFAKQVMDVNEVATPAVIDCRISNFSSLTYGVLGGILLGNIKQTVTSFGTIADEVTVGSDGYFVMTNNSTARFLIPKK